MLGRSARRSGGLGCPGKARHGNVDFSDSRSVIHPTSHETAPRIIVFLFDVSAVCRRSFRSQLMSVNKDQVKGRAKEAAGKVQETAGKMVGNKTQEVKGKINKNVGAAQAKYGDVKSDMKDSDRMEDRK
jgi:uncharacterized protein YjbJ (UPF0337 family)